MIIMMTSAVAVSIHAVSPLFGVGAGVAAGAAAAAGAAFAAAGAGVAAAGAGASAAGFASVAGLSCARTGARAPSAMSIAIKVSKRFMAVSITGHPPRFLRYVSEWPARDRTRTP